MEVSHEGFLCLALAAHYLGILLATPILAYSRKIQKGGVEDIGTFLKNALEFLNLSLHLKKLERTGCCILIMKEVAIYDKGN